MTIRTTSLVGALLVAAAFGCERNDKPSRTETTSAEDNFIERTRVIDDMFVNPSDNPAAWGTDASAAKPADAGARAKEPVPTPPPAPPRDPSDPPPIAPR